MKPRLLLLPLIALLVPAHAALGETFTDRATWAAQVGAPPTTESFDAISTGGHASPLSVAWGTITSPFGTVYVHPFGPTGGLNLGSSFNSLVPRNPSSVLGFGFNVGGSQFSQAHIIVSAGDTVVLDTLVAGQTFFGWKRDGEGLAALTVQVNSSVGLLEIDDVSFAFEVVDPQHQAILQRLDERLDVAVSSRASQQGVDDLAGVVNGRLDDAISSRASQHSLDALVGAVATQASLQALAQQAATQASVAALSQKLDALSAAIGALQSEVAIIRQLVDKNGKGPK